MRRYRVEPKPGTADRTGHGGDSVGVATESDSPRDDVWIRIGMLAEARYRRHDRAVGLKAMAELRDSVFGPKF